MAEPGSSTETNKKAEGPNPSGPGTRLEVGQVRQDEKFLISSLGLEESRKIRGPNVDPLNSRASIMRALTTRTNL